MSDETDTSIPSRRVRWALLAIGTLIGTMLLYFTEPSLWDSSDYALFYRPNFTFLHDAIWSGTLPLWNPFIGLGRPFLGDTQNAVFYPPLWLVALGPNIALVLLVWGHNLFALIGMRRFAGACGAAQGPAWLAAGAFVLCGPLVSRWTSGQIMYCCAIAYVPTLFQLARCGLDGFSWRRVAWLATLLAAQFLCGHPQIFWVTGMGMGLYLLGRGLYPFKRQAWQATGLALCQLALASVWSIALVACVLLPFTDLIAQGNRVDSAAFASFGKEPSSAFLSLFGTLKPIWEYNLFLGWWLALPGIAGLAMVRNPEVRAWCFVGIISTFIALGDSSPIFELTYKIVPGLGKFRFPARMALMIPFGLIVTGALWFSHPPTRRGALAMLTGALGVAVFAVFALYEDPVNQWQLPRVQNLLFFALPATVALACHCCWPGRTAFVVLCAGAFIEVASEAWSTKTIYGMENVSGLDPAHPGQWLLVDHLEKEFGDRANGVPPRVLIDSHAVPENYGMIHGYSSPDAYTSLFLKRPWDYLHALAGIPAPTLNNTYLSYEVYKRVPFPWTDIGLEVGLNRETGELIANPNPSPRAWVSPAASPPLAMSEVIRRLTNGHNIYQTALVERPTTLVTATPLASPQPVTIERFENDRVELVFTNAMPGLLVLAEAWYPGWRAEVNGMPSKVLPANCWMRATHVPAGENRVVFFYRERKFALGLTITACSLALLILAFRLTESPGEPHSRSPILPGRHRR